MRCIILEQCFSSLYLYSAMHGWVPYKTLHKSVYRRLFSINQEEGTYNKDVIPSAELHSKNRRLWIGICSS